MPALMQTISSWLGGSPAAWVILAVTARLLYLFGVGSLLFKEHRDHETVNRYGHERAFARFRSIASSLMKVDSLCLFLLPIGAAGSLSLPTGAALTIGALLIAVGIGIKLWAAATLGMDGYYWRDTYVPSDKQRIVLDRGRTGPYRYFKNPMYGIGNLHIIGWAVIWQSAAGVVVGCAAILGLFIFYRLVEKPQIRRIEALLPAVEKTG